MQHLSISFQLFPFGGISFFFKVCPCDLLNFLSVYCNVSLFTYTFGNFSPLLPLVNNFINSLSIWLIFHRTNSLFHWFLVFLLLFNLRPKTDNFTVYSFMYHLFSQKLLQHEQDIHKLKSNKLYLADIHRTSHSNTKEQTFSSPAQKHSPP